MKKGRVPARAELVAFNAHAVYELSAFKQMPKQGEKTPSTARPIQIDSNNVVRLADIRELERYGVSNRVMALCVQGNDPENPTKYPSRSEALYDAVCQLVRARVPDDVIYSIITDPEYHVSASIIEKGRAARTVPTICRHGQNNTSRRRLAIIASSCTSQRAFSLPEVSRDVPQRHGI